MLIYSEMSPHRATNPLGLLTGPSERQIALLLGRRGKQQRIKSGKGKEMWCFPRSCKKRRQIRGGRLQVGVGGRDSKGGEGI